MNLVGLIEQRLRAAFTPIQLTIADHSHRHLGHQESQGRGHFQVCLVSPQFRGKTMMARHRLVYVSLADVMATHVHALGLQLYTPEEWARHMASAVS